MVGKSLSHYKILAELGRGGMGIVYKAEDTRLDRTVAVKVLPSAALASDDDRARFYREAKAAAQLHHPHIAGVFEIDEAVPSDAPHGTQPSPFIAMEFIDGETLQERIKQGPLKLEEAVRIACEIAGALEAAHEKDIVHRDIKSANVMLTGKGVAKVLDFGLAQTAASTKLTKMGSTVGTVAYMSPEQARGEDVDLRTDLWSLGAVLYEMVSGRSAFPGDYEQAVVYEILNQDPEPLTAIRTGVPMGLEWIVAKCLAKEAKDRYQTATDLLVDLRNVDLAAEGMSRMRSGVTQTRRAAIAFDRKPSLIEATRVSWPVIAIAFLAALGLGHLFFSTSSQVPGHSFVGIPLPDSIHYGDPAWSPDGTRLLFTAKDGVRDNTYIAEYDFTNGTLRRRTAADGSARAIYDPSGRSIYFGAPGYRLISKSNATGTESVISDQYRGAGVTWLEDGRLAYNKAWDGINAVHVDKLASDSAIFTGLFTGFDLVNAQGHDLLFSSYAGVEVSGQHTVAHDVATGEGVRSLDTLRFRTPIAFTDNGFLITRPPARGQLGAWPLHPDERRFSGPEMTFFHVGHAAVSPQGHLAYLEPYSTAPAPAGEIFYSLDQRGAAQLIAQGRDIGMSLYNDFSFAPDGERFVLEADGLTLYDFSTGSPFGLADGGLNMQPFWSPDGGHIYYRDRVDASWALFRIRPDGSGKELLFDSQYDDGFPTVSHDGRLLAFQREMPGTGDDVFVRNLTSDEEIAISVANGSQTEPEISPDGKWVAFISGEDRRLIISSSDGKSLITIAAGGSGRPHWSPDGRTLYYLRSGPWRIVHRSFSGSNTDVSSSELWGPEITLRSVNIDHLHFAAHPAGGVVISLPGILEEENAGQWKVIFNWTSSLTEAAKSAP